MLVGWVVYCGLYDEVCVGGGLVFDVDDVVWMDVVYFGQVEYVFVDVECQWYVQVVEVWVCGF